MAAWARGLALAAGFGAVAAAVVWLGVAWNSSRVPGDFGALELGPVDYGGGPPAHDGHGRSLAALREPDGVADVRIQLVAQTTEITLPSGRRIRALTFDGRVPGPELRVHERDLLEVRLLNRDIREGVSIHWHGVDLPNAEDGVSGVTQDRVMPGGSFVYRFRARYAGTYWYHSHQQSADEVERGLYGALVVLPRHPVEPVDVVALAHTIDGVPLLGDSDRPERRRVDTGTPVRLRLINSADGLRRFGLAGTGFRVVAIDGRDKPGGGTITGASIVVPAGGRYDIAFTMPEHAVVLGIRSEDVGLTLDPGHGPPPALRFGADFDAATYGKPSAPVPARFDRQFAVNIGRRLGFFEGGVHFGWQWTINGKAFPRMPMYMLRTGETVEFRFANRSNAAHPMHLHGHHMLVFARDGRPVTPWWSDTLEIGQGERYDVAVIAENPGVWMFHCHNLPHAAHGLVTHVAYEGVTTPFRMGKSSGNEPE